jgi:uncharacterized membrane protein YhaH (DUF805 family)
MKRLSMLAALAGGTILVCVIAHARLSTLACQLRAVRMALPIVLGLSFCRLQLQTTAWLQVLRKEGSIVTRGELLGIRLASQSMGYLTMLGALISEPMKVKLLQGPVDEAATATLVDDAVYWMTSAISGLIGCACILLLTAHTGRFVASTVMILVFFAFIVFITLRVPALPLICRRLKDGGPSWLRRAASIETAVREHRIVQPKLVRRMFEIDLLCQMLLTSEVFVVLWALQLPIHPAAVLSIDGFTRMTKVVSSWIPARLGVDEAAAISAFSVAGLSPILGLTLALTRRSRDLLWSLCGIAWLAWRSHHSSQTKIKDQLLNREEASI